MASKLINIDFLKEKARRCRREILETIFEAGSGHPGGSLSSVEILITLYYYKMNHDSSNPDWPLRGPAYMRLSRPPFPIITKDSDEFILGRANVMREGRDITVIACGLMVYEALQAAEILKKENIETRVINMHTIKPIDREVVIKSAQETGAIVTAEEHQINGGLGSAVAEVLARNFPVLVEMVAVNDTFGESGESEELLQKYHLKDIDIVDAVKRAIARKKKG